MPILYQFLGVLLILVGLPLFWTPLPVGLVLIAIGAALILSNSERARIWMRERRRRHPRLDALMLKAERVTPHPFDRILKQTDLKDP